MRALSPECRLVFRTAGPGDAAGEVARLAAGPVDWLRTLYIAEKEFAVPALWEALERGGAAARPPAEVAERLRRHAMVSGFRMQRLSERLQGAVRALAARDIPVLLLKGAALGALTDPTFRSRPMSDLDVLVRDGDVERARAALLADGWVHAPDPALHEALQGHHHLAPFIDPAVPDLRLELHRAMLPSSNVSLLDESAVWAEARRAPAPFAGALVPSPEHLLLHACVHFAWAHAMHFGAWRSFRLANDLVTRGLVDWTRFLAHARASRSRSSCYWTLRLAARLGDVAVPDDVLARLEVPPQAWLRDALERGFIADIATGEGMGAPSLRVSRLLWRLAMRPGVDARADAARAIDERWIRARVAEPGEALGPRLLRHARGLGRWAGFMRTLLIPD